MLLICVSDEAWGAGRTPAPVAHQPLTSTVVKRRKTNDDLDSGSEGFDT